jgi:NADPH2:quinone reductase
MQAIRVRTTGTPDALRLEDTPDPVPAGGDVVIRLLATGVNFIDVYQRTGQYAVPLPYTPGTEGAGVVVAVGRDADASLLGQIVASTAIRGSYAALATVPADKVVVVPEGMPATVAGGVMLQGITAHYLATSTFPLHEGHTCLVHAAAGGVGLLLCQVAKLRGATVIGVTSTEEKARLARAAGADEVLTVAPDDLASRVRELTDGRGVDVVYDSVGAATFAASLDALRPRGMMVLFGQSSGPVPPVDPQLLNARGSLFLTRPTIAHYQATREELLWRCNDLFRWFLDDPSCVLHLRRVHRDALRRQSARRASRRPRTEHHTNAADCPGIQFCGEHVRAAVGDVHTQGAHLHARQRNAIRRTSQRGHRLRACHHR